MKVARLRLLGLSVVALGLVGCGGSNLSFEAPNPEDDVGATGEVSADGASDTAIGADSDLDSAAPIDVDLDTGTVLDTGVVTDTGVVVLDTGTVTDTGVLLDTSVVDTGPVDTGPDTSGCPTLVLGGATEDVYVDKNAAFAGNGTKTCPFRTIRAATALAAPGVSTTLRTIHVKGYLSSPDYVETGGPVVLAAKVTLTSNYDTNTDGNRAAVRIVARGDCSSVAGFAAQCAVAMNNASRIERVSVRNPALSSTTTGHDILTTATLPASGVAAPRITEVICDQAYESGIRVLGSADVGPTVNAISNRNGGLVAQRSLSGVATATVRVLDAPSLSGAPSNNFSNNSGHGISVFGAFELTIEGASTASNTGYGVQIGTPYTATTTTYHSLSNIQSTYNGNSGFRLLSGEARFASSTSWINRFNYNRNWGIETTLGDSLGSARLTLLPLASSTPGPTTAHEARFNGVGGVRVAQVTPAGTSAHAISSLTTSSNGSTSVPGYGISIEVVGVNQPSVVLRQSTALANTGVGLRFQRASGNTLDIGTTTTGGYNVFGDATGVARNGKAAICYDNLTSTAVTQAAELDRWSNACPLPLTSTTFQASLGTGACASNSSYVEITYRNTTAPFSAVAACY